MDDRDSLQSMRPDYVVHWTGKKIEGDRRVGPRAEEKSAAYVTLLRSILRDGLRFGFLEKERLMGDPGTRVYTPHSAVCFSEIRLSAAHTHAGKYGRLGIGFSRDFIAKKGGGPVAYTGNTTSTMVANLELVRKHLFQLHTHELGGAVDELLRGLDFGGAPGRKVEDLRMHVEAAMTFMRATSDDLGAEPRYDLLDEHEWRLVALHSRPWIAGDGSEGNPLRVIIGVRDVELIVFPDTATRRMALDDDGIMSRLPAHRSDQPVMLTLEGNYSATCAGGMKGFPSKAS